MSRINELPHRDVSRRDTLVTRTSFHYDPTEPCPTTPILVGKFVVQRRPLADSVHTLYVITDKRDVVRMQISYPTEADCAGAVSARRATSLALAKAKKSSKKSRQAHPMSLKEAV
jgi:hypothetical protein